MGDDFVTFEKLVNGHAAHAARLAVLWPLGAQRGKPTTATLLKSSIVVLERWRRRLVQLKENNWAPLLKTPNAIQYFRNCHPSMVMPSEKLRARVCDHKDICPWCYGRRVSELYEAVAKARTSDESLVAIVGHTKEPVSRSLKELLGDYRRKLLALVTANKANCRGTYWAITCEPEGKEDNYQWKVTQRILALVPMGLSFDWVPSEWDVKSYLRPSPEDLANAVCRAVSYPRGLMHGPAHLTTEVLHARSELRLSETYGRFRSRKEKVAPIEKPTLHLHQPEELIPGEQAGVS